MFQYVPTKITYMVFSCGEFPSMRKYGDDVENVSEAIARWNELRKELLIAFQALAFWYIHWANKTGRCVSGSGVRQGAGEV